MPQEQQNQLGAIIAFAIYSICYEAIIWGIFGWAVFVNERSPAWVLVAILMSGAQLRAHQFGIKTQQKE